MWQTPTVAARISAAMKKKEYHEIDILYTLNGSF